jgi:methionine synthase II (cobalamin-independent)
MEAVMQRPGFRAVPTVVGSFPHTDPRLLVDRILARFAEMPAWPQMPARDWRESMYVQYSEGLPGAVVDPREHRIYFRGGEALYAEIESFYQALIDDDVERFAITANFARGLSLFLESVPRLNPRPKWVKGQVTGPFSFAMTVTDEDKRSLAYDPDLYEVAVQGMAMKARWLARRLRQVAECALVTLDEPYLCSFGSAFVNVPRGDVIAAIESSVEAIHKEGALAGLHCCGNTDWSLVLSTGLDVINFDAYEYFQGLTLYPEPLRKFLVNGGILSWGIVPASRACADLDAHALLDALDNRVGQLAAKGMDRGMIYRQSLLTPACGLATESVERADRAVDALLELSDLVREREGRG